MLSSPPYHLVQILTAEHLVGVAQQKQQQLELLVLERQLTAAYERRACVGVHDERACGHDALVLLLGGLQALVLRKICLDAGDEDARRKRLFDVIVRTGNYAEVIIPGSYDTACGMKMCCIVDTDTMEVCGVCSVA